MKKIWAWGALVFGLLYFTLPLIGMTNFSLKMRRGEYSFDAYGKVFTDPRFQETFTYSVMQALFTIVFGVLLVVPTAYWVRLKLPRLRPVIEFITLLPLAKIGIEKLTFSRRDSVGCAGAHSRSIRPSIRASMASAPTWTNCTDRLGWFSSAFTIAAMPRHSATA